MSQPYRLVTMGPSHFCEKARWALSRAGVPYQEERHVPLYHAPASYRAGGRRTVPVLVTDSGTIADSTGILELADRHSGGRIYGEGGNVRRLSRELEEKLDARFGPDTRRFVYFHILDDKQQVTQAFGHGAPLSERAAFSVTYPLIKRLMKRSMRITAEASKRSHTRMNDTFSEMGELLSDGRRYLTGDQLTAADITFAALAAPVLLPHGYGAPLPSIDEVPEQLAAEVRRYRETPAGKFAMRLFREERNKQLTF
ncbi:MAG: glutathione S-transferase [Myxococcales bacterium]|nr:glutathione S-transferase [Myxococcales bacterium]MCB9582672.1 glutathione S-transferase [Polyangiaceae bacterium]